ncbi:MAG: DNA translocase FtsK 4TM domain-containing protein [Pseudomonadota bacterium]|nr:DNA translocase FtsK 4TM domain-containing protein [Pseudomonadota bacterium]
MKNSNKNIAKPELLKTTKRLYYITNIVMVSFAIFIAIALISYNHADPGFTKSFSDNNYIANVEGVAGAWLADLLLYFLGISSALMPVLIILFVWFKSDLTKYNINIYTVFGVFLLFVAVNGLLALHIPAYGNLPAGIGGALGEYIAWKFVSLLNVIGSSFVLVTLTLCAFVLIKPDINFDFLYKSCASFLKNIWQRICTCFREFKLPEFFLNSNRKAVSETSDVAQNSGFVFPEKIATTANSTSSNTNPVTDKSTIESKQEPVIKAQSSQVTVKSNPVSSQKTSNIELQMNSNTSHFTRIEMPAATLLDEVERNQRVEIAKSVIINLSKDVEKKFLDFGFKLDVVAVYPGPVVTRFELKLAAGTKVSSISNLAKDLARTLSVTSVRIVDVIPGKSVIGLEIPNTKRQIVRLRDLISSNSYTSAVSPVTIILGKDISGHPVVVDLAKMPHLLVAGTTGSGKSVGLNAMLLSFLYKSSCENLRLILIDPKMLELSVYDDIPHLLTPVITDMREAAGALRWCVAEMERRYKLMSVLGVRNIAGYNEKVDRANKEGSPLLDPLFMSEDGAEPPLLQKLPAIVVVADEYADMIMVLGKKVEQLIARLAQKARAAGIHLVLATQRPSVNVVTGLIKANIPTRIAFQVSSRIDSRTVLDQQGAEQLLGHGDMLYLPPGTGVPVRVHGAYVSDDEVHRVVKFIKDNNPPPEYVNNLIESFDNDESSNTSSGDIDGSSSGEKDPLYDEAVSIVAKTKKVSISSIQRKLKIGYNRSANIVEAMEKAGVVSAPSHNGTREVMINEI